jgi:hypothetical protein
MKKTIYMGLYAGILALVMVASLGTSNLAIAANPNTDTPNLAGQQAAGIAQCTLNCLGEPNTNKGGMGEHSSSFAGESRNGLPNALTGPGDPQHPSEVIGFVCDNFGPCPSKSNP